MMNNWFGNGSGYGNGCGTNVWGSWLGGGLTLLVLLGIAVAIYFIWRGNKHNGGRLSNSQTFSTAELAQELANRKNNADLAQQVAELKQQLNELKEK